MSSIGLLARAICSPGRWEEAQRLLLPPSGLFADDPLPRRVRRVQYISNKEWIWGHPQTLSQSSASYNFYFLDATYVGAYSSFMADPHFRDTFSDGDIRLELFQWMREGYLGYKKFHMRADDTADIVLMRASEMLLVEAEALARDGFPEKAVVPLNELRHARGLGDYDLTGKSQQDVIDEILMERRRELWGEGFGITDILRTQQSVKRAMLSAKSRNPGSGCLAGRRRVR